MSIGGAWRPKGHARPTDRETTFYIDDFRRIPKCAVAPRHQHRERHPDADRPRPRDRDGFRQIYQRLPGGASSIPAQGQSPRTMSSRSSAFVRPGREYRPGGPRSCGIPAVDGNMRIPDLTQVATARPPVLDTTEKNAAPCSDGQQRLERADPGDRYCDGPVE